MRLPKVLIVEDESSIAELISVNLKHNGFAPVWAVDGEAAQREIDAVLPDAILLDWMLPGQSGLALAKKWRSDPRTKAVPIIMLTARGDEPDKVSGLNSGADDYITKPFSTQELVARIRAVLRRRSPEQTMERVQVGHLVLDGSTHRVSFHDQALKLVNDHQYGNGTAIFTNDGGAARRYQNEVEVGMVGINVPIPVPMAYFSFGGWKNSLFGDSHAHGTDGVHFFTRGKVVTSRWLDPSHGGINLGFPQNT
mgnify:CR=1 FL=1